MIVKRKLFSFIDEEGNMGYYLYNEATGEEKLFSMVEYERMYARGTKEAGKLAKEFLSKKGNKAANKAAKKALEATTPIGTRGLKDVRVYRYVNSPMSMNGTWPEDTGANYLQTKITKRGGSRYLGILSGTANKPAYDNRIIVGGGYHAPNPKLTDIHPASTRRKKPLYLDKF